MELSIIIPTLNEEKYLPFLLEKIKGEELGDSAEIIVADAGSTDDTIKIAKKYGCRVIKGGLPARGRNNGGKYAKGAILFFIDADILFKKGLIKNGLEEFKEKGLSVASFGIYTHDKDIIMNRTTLNIFYNLPQRIFKGIAPLGAMGIMATKEAFKEVKGFDEDIKLAEDHYFVKKISKIGKFDVLKSGKLYMPLRRFKQDGYFKTFFKYLFCLIFMAIRGPMKKDIINYNFDHYNKKK
jgi:glycosyltransferase involved in cell wall biosynthesis